MANVAKLLTIQGGKCFYCGKKISLDDATIDHVVPKAMGGDNTEANTVACCHSINHAFGHATPKEKLTALINADGRIDCPSVAKKKTAPLSPPAVPVASTTVTGLHEKPSLEPIRKSIQEAFQSASAANSGQKALLSTLGTKIKERIDGFKPKTYGHQTLGKLMNALGYQVEKLWCYRQQK